MNIPAPIARLLNSPAGRIIKRIIVAGLIAGAVTFGNLATTAQLFTPAHISDMSLWGKVLVGAEGAAVGSVLTAVQSLISQWLTGEPNLLPLLRLATRCGRCQAIRPRTVRHLAALQARPAGRRYGKLPAAPLAKSVRLEPHVGSLPTPPAALNWADRVQVAWGMMLNDRLGDCTCAAVGHAIQLATGVATGQPVTIPDASVLALYEAVSDYDPATGANDNGAVEADVLKRWRTCGVPGAGHKITAYGRVDHRNTTLVKQLIDLLGFAYIGTEVPAEWEQSPVWDVSDSQIVGGHAVILVGWDDTGFWLVSWGQLYKLTYAAFSRYVDEVWGVVTSDWLTGGKAPSGLDVAGLLADLTVLEHA